MQKYLSDDTQDMPSSFGHAHKVKRKEEEKKKSLTEGGSTRQLAQKGLITTGKASD